METRLRQEAEPVTQQVALLFRAGAPNTLTGHHVNIQQMNAQPLLLCSQPLGQPQCEQEMQEELSQGGERREKHTIAMFTINPEPGRLFTEFPNQK